MLCLLSSAAYGSGWDDPFTEGINEGAIGQWDDPFTEEINEGAIEYYIKPTRTKTYGNYRMTNEDYYNLGRDLYNIFN